MGISIKNSDRLLKKFTNIENMDLTDVMSECTLLVEGQAKELCPVKTGDLRGSIHPEVKKRGKTFAGRVFTQKWYAPYVEFGTGPKGSGTYPYVIKGFKLKYRATAWSYTPDEGQTFIWTRGQKAQPYMYPALQMHKEHIKKKISDAIAEQIAKNTGGGS